MFIKTTKGMFKFEGYSMIPDYTETEMYRVTLVGSIGSKECTHTLKIDTNNNSEFTNAIDYHLENNSGYCDLRKFI